MKGTISRNMRAILSDDEGRKQLRRLLVTTNEGQVQVGTTKYKVSTRSASSVRDIKSDKLRVRRTLDSLKRSAG